jgi:O-antigen ligase
MGKRGFKDLILWNRQTSSMCDKAIKFILILLFIFTPVAFGSMGLWAFSLMELSILLIILLWGFGRFFANEHRIRAFAHLRIYPVVVLLSLFLLLVLFQMVPLPSGIIKMISPKAYELRQSLSVADFQFLNLNSKFSISLVPFATRIEFFKWFTLISFFIFLLLWKPSNKSILNLIPIVMLVGVAESLYGIFEFFSGHRHLLHLKGGVSTVTGTFINHNYFAGYLLMVIPLSIGYLFSREGFQKSRFGGWRHRLSSSDGKATLIKYCIVLMILSLFFSASRMGILSLLLSFSLLSLLFRDPRRGERFSKTSVLIFGLALLWAAWIGLDAVISRFFTASEDFKSRWMFWVNTFQIFKDFPLLGSGLGTFAQIFPEYRSFHILGLVTHAENDFLQLTSEIGLIGIGLLLIPFLFFFYKAISGIRFLSHEESQRYIGMGGMVGILALMFHSLVERNIQVPANAFLFTFLFAMVLRIGLVKKEDGLTQAGGSAP